MSAIWDGEFVPYPRARSSGTDLEQATMTSTKTPVSTLMDRQRRHDIAMREVESYLLKNPKAPPPKKEVTMQIKKRQKKHND